MDEKLAQALAELEAKNQWRGGLSDAERTCFELGWDAAIAELSTPKKAEEA